MYTYIPRKTASLKYVFCLFFILAIGQIANAQLSDLHYLPPLKQGQNNGGIQNQAIHLSTPEPTTFTVNVYRGTNPAPWRTYNINNNNPTVIDAGEGLTNGDNNITLVNNANTGVVLTNSGLRFESPSGNRFYVNYRGNSSAQAASLTAKGRQALGTAFKWGGVPNLGGRHPSKSNTLGIMATEDNTTVTLFGYDPDCTFRIGNNANAITDNTYTITLNANESFVFENYVGNINPPSLAQQQGWLGASIEADKDIVISNGSINFGRQVGQANRDAGIDQPVPENRLGKDYVFIRGNGASNGWTEFPLLIAIEDNTQVFANGSPAPLATLNTGDFFEVPSSYYSSNTVGANMFVQTSKNVYAYQCLGGDSKAWTQGLNFVAPVNCLLPDVMDNIPDIRNMAGATVTGGMTIIAAVNTPDANIIVEDGNGPVTLPASNPVAGSADWKTFYVPNLNGNVSVQSTGPMAVGFFGFDGNRGVAGYFSGFDTVPEVILEIRGGTGCFVGSEIFEATESFDAYQWYRDGQLIPGANGANYAPTTAGDYYVRGTKGPCTYDSNTIEALYCDPDIVVEKTVDNDEIVEGETATFTIRVRNNGVGPITNLQVIDNIPTGLTLESYFTIHGSWSGNTWNIGTLDGGDVAQLELEVRGDEIDILPFLALTNTVSHTQDQTDVNTTDDRLSVNITVHNDFDNDGIIDSVDLDDDNDGITDIEECFDFFCAESIVNESFENPGIPLSSYATIHENSFDGWSTTASDGQIEVWGSGFNGVTAFEGNQFVELNANQTSALYQDLCLTPGTVIEWSLRHRGRAGIDVMQVRIGESLATAAVQGTMSDGTAAWGYYSDTYTVPTDQTNTVFIFEAVSTGSGDNTVGNFIDDIQINIISAPSCRDSDNDGYPDSLDLDSDNDGCSDANEYYKDNNADGGDDGEYGTGTPTINPDGTVVDASYIGVVAPEIILGNTSEDLSNTDINGQGIALGTAFQYVLRFQNTGDDDATNYTIRNILPDNVTLDNIDIIDAPGVTFPPFGPNTKEITFTVPDDLIEVGDPEYTIRIEVTLFDSCSNFVNACSTQLQNRAYSTFQGVNNTTEFTDEEGRENFPCDTTPQVAENTVLGDLANCNIARDAILCGDDVLLSAGTGFTNYVWSLYTVDGGGTAIPGTPINDGDPDNDPSTLLVTNTGNYMVQKSGASGCADMTELINVVRFGATQTNPVIDYFNLVNSDSNPDNDINGEIATCGIDGRDIPKIFLCGENDEAFIQLGISDAQSIDWEVLTGCPADVSDPGDDCPITNNTCTWANLTTPNDTDYTVTDEGRYRVVIRYQDGCRSTFYFNVFQNNLDFNVQEPRDIVCDTPGNIRITGVPAGYGFQLINVNTNSIVVPFVVDQPSFDISSEGTYRVQMTQLNPTTGNPIVGACIFETDNIGIDERDFNVNIPEPTPAYCGDKGSITVQALNVLPFYNYELRLDDGSNTLATPIVRTDQNTHTFDDLNPGDYIVVTKTDDGCEDTQNITVPEIDQLTLKADLTANITCNQGVVTLTPDGGIPNPNYLMAIWSIDGVQQHSDASSVPDAEKQTTQSFFFDDITDAGDYQFIVFDSSDPDSCHAFSNIVTVRYLGSPEIDEDNTTHTPITCADTATSTLTVVVTGGTAPYEYSLDGGTNYQDSNVFPNLSAGQYTITVMDSSGPNNTGCIATLNYEIDQPFRLTASAAIIEDATCGNPNGALVRIVNVNGGQGPYEYSFDGGSTFNPLPLNESRLLPGNHQLVVKDALECTFDMDLIVPDLIPDPTLSHDAIDYACDGTGTVTITTSNTSDFEYTYTVPSTWTATANDNIFSNVPAGTHTITVDYINTTAPNQTQLFLEDFGAGPTTQIGEIGPDYCYEPQDISITTTCNFGPPGILVDGEYTVTNSLTNPLSIYTSPQDHTGLTDGRFLAIGISTFSTSGSPVLNSILWARRDLEVVPNEDITLNFWAYNFRNSGSAGNNPEVLIEILDSSGTIIHSAVASDPTGTVTEIPKNTGNTDWHERTITFNPGANTDIDIVFRNNVNSNDGNELILDDITATQALEICPGSQGLTVVVEDNQAFSATFLSATDPSCNGVTDGTIRFEVANFDAAVGFEYSYDDTTWSAPIMSSPFTTPITDNLGDGSHTIYVRRAGDDSCKVNFTETLTAPSVIVPTLTLTADYTCLNSSATLTASAIGGSPGYQYQLERTSAPVGIVTGYDFATNGSNATFSNNITDGDYVLSVRDANGCIVTSTSAITVAAPRTVAFDTTYTNCYDGLNNATITVTVTDGNGDYTFSLNGGTPLTPDTLTPNTYTFTGLANDTYTVEVFDAYGCSASNAATPIVIDQTLTATVTPVDVSCTDGSITVAASGGDGNYVYAFLPTGTPVSDSDFATTNNPFTVNAALAAANPFGFDVYVRDNGGASTPNIYCQYSETVIVNTAPTLTFTPTPTDPQCHDGMGSIAINITSGDGPFTIEIVDLDNGGVSDQTVNNVLATTYDFYNLMPGDYTINITDDYGCTVSTTPNVSVNNPDELTADLETILTDDCAPASGFRFMNYPTIAQLGGVGTLQFSADGGTTWQTSDTFNTFTSGDIVEPVIRLADGSSGTSATLCRFDLPEYTLIFPLDDLNITIDTIVVNCNELQVFVEGTLGTAPYEYAFTDDPRGFDVTDPATVWQPQTTVNYTDSFGVLQTSNQAYIWTGLIPGKTYVFYVRDSNGCIRQSDRNVNDITTNPMNITATFEPSCNLANDGEITYTIVDTDGLTEPSMEWELFDVATGSIIRSSGNGTTSGLAPVTIPYGSSITVDNLPANEYYIMVYQVDGGGTRQCISGSENLLLNELDAITGTPAQLRRISCDRPGLIEIPDIQGGGGTYTYEVVYTNPLDASDPLNGTTIVSTTSDNPIEIPANSPGGDYEVYVTDQYSCSTSLGNINLTLSDNPEIHDIVVDNCGPQANITVTSLSATPIHYSIDDGAGYADSNTTGLFGNVPVGTYTITILNNDGCTDTDTVTINPSLQANARLTQSLGCMGHDAEITVEAIAGSGDYHYEVLDASNNIVASGSGNLTTASNTAQVPITSAGTYTVNISDTNTDGPCVRSFSIPVAAAVTPTIVVDSHSDATCNGADNGTITVTASNLVTGTHTIQIISGTGAVISTFPINAPNGGTTVTFENLEATITGIDYTLQITSPNGCTNTVSQQITEPETISVSNLDRIEYRCASGNTPSNASVSFTSATGGSGNYVRYQFFRDGNPVPVQDGTNPTWIETDAAGGSYTLTVYDDNGCSGTSAPIIVAPFDQMSTPTIHVGPEISCVNTGEQIRIDVTGSVTNSTANLANYDFTVLSTGLPYTQDTTNPNVFTQLQVGTYTFNVRNIATGCETTVTHTVEQPNTFDIDVDSIANVVCFGDDGSIDVTVTDASYTGDYNWEILNSDGTPTTRTDDEGTRTGSGTITNIPVAGGKYIIRITQDTFPDCSQERAFSITTPPAQIDLDPIVTTSVSCADGEGSALIQPIGGQAPYDITIVGLPTVPSVNSHLFQGLSAGTYDIIVRDALGCERTFDDILTLVLPEPITGSYDLSNITLECQGDTDASIAINLNVRNVDPGANYTFVLNTYSDTTGSTLLISSASQDSPTFNNLGAGYYRIVVTDDMGCTFDDAPIVVIEDPNEVEALLVTHMAPTCQTDAQLLLVASGGQGPYEWSESENGIYQAMNNRVSADTHLFENVSPRSQGYQYYLRDANGCTSIISNAVFVNPIEDLAVTVNDSAAIVNCNGDSTAFIQAEATGGLGDYEYALLDQDRTTVLSTNQNGAFADLPVGTYYIRVQSGNDCEVISEEIPITEPTPLQVTPDIMEITCSDAADGAITLNVQGGTGDYQFAISPNLDQFDDENSFDGLGEGDYIAIVQDGNGCFEVVEFSLVAPDPIEVTSVTVTDEICFESADGTVTIEVNGGTAPYFISLNSNADADFTQDVFEYNNLASGTHVIFIRDANGCETTEVFEVNPGVNLAGEPLVEYICNDGITTNRVGMVFEDQSILNDVLYGLDTSDPDQMVLDGTFEGLTGGDHYITVLHSNGCPATYNFSITEFEPLALQLTESNINTISALATGGSGNYTFAIDDRSTTNDSIFYITETATYTITVTDENGCSVSSEIFIEFIDVEIPNFFTPDGDGNNDTWAPSNIEQYENIFIKIYDRYGRTLYEFKGNDDDWDGQYQLNDLPTGDYWYIIKLNGIQDEREFIGNFTLYR